jgi:ketosteroid isomerase-like protein
LLTVPKSGLQNLPQISQPETADLTLSQSRCKSLGTMTQPAADATDPIAASRNIWDEAVKAGDVDKIVSIFCDDVILMPPNDTSLFGKGEAVEWWKGYFEYFKVTVLYGTERQVRIIGDIGIEEWTYMIAIDPVRGGERIRDDGRSLTIWKCEPDGVWRVSQNIWNSTRPIGSGTSRFLAKLKQP